MPGSWTVPTEAQGAAHSNFWLHRGNASSLLLLPGRSLGSGCGGGMLWAGAVPVPVWQWDTCAAVALALWLG